MSLLDRIDGLWEERPIRSGAVAASARSGNCKNPTPCGDRVRSGFRPKSPTDDERVTADRMAALSNSLKSALLCRNAADIAKYIKSLGQALAGIKKAVASPAAKKAFDAESYIKCPATESTNFPSKYASPVATSSRTGIGTAPIVDGRTEIELNDLKRRRLKSIKRS